jgi:hypothetical protein
MADGSQLLSLSDNRPLPPSNPAPSVMTAIKIPGLSSIKKDLPIDSVARYFGGTGYKADAATRDRIRRAIDLASELVSPQGTYTLCSVAEISPGVQIFLENGSGLFIPECFVDQGVRLVATAIGTLGGSLEKQCRQLAGEGQIYESTLLDAVGTAMLDLLGEKISRTIAQDGHRLGLFKGQRFGPGLDGYPLEQQKILFGIADNESVGVLLNSSAIMVPTKSISFFLMLTKTVQKNEVTNKCNSCRLTGCKFRMVPNME